ncbi:MAG: molybdenum cofactor guanylyltransferase [Bryobacteraceae bacterium]
MDGGQSNLDGGGSNSRAGFVLTGGRSSRMGRDKALLDVGGTTLVGQIAGHVCEAAGSVTLVGGAGRYESLGYAILSDVVENAGPMGGLLTVLRLAARKSSGAEWNLVVACDMPSVTAGFLRGLLDAAEASGAGCVVPETSEGLHPLCAVYHRRLLPAVERAIDHKILKMRDFLKNIGAEPWPVADGRLLRNINTPAEWTAR